MDTRSIYPADIDEDGDVDILSASGLDNKIAWYENDGKGQFSERKFITTLVGGASNIYTTDLDRDGDMDTQQISTTHLAKGLYFYQVINVDGRVIANGKVIKH